MKRIFAAIMIMVVFLFVISQELIGSRDTPAIIPEMLETCKEIALKDPENKKKKR